MAQEGVSTETLSGLRFEARQRVYEVIRPNHFLDARSTVPDRRLCRDGTAQPLDESRETINKIMKEKYS